MTKERFVEFLEANIFNKYKNHLIILDNAGSHNNEYVKQAIINSGNKYLFSLPYTPKTNRTIEEFFNQIKHYLKLNKKVLKYDELVSFDSSIPLSLGARNIYKKEGLIYFEDDSRCKIVNK